MLLAAFCSYYVFLFSVLLNRCAKCGPPDSTDDDDVSNCNTCPDSMRDNDNPNQDIAFDWLISVLYSVAFNVIIMEPFKAGIKAAVYPMVANWALKINWEMYLLSGNDDDILKELDDLDDVGIESDDEEKPTPQTPSSTSLSSSSTSLAVHSPVLMNHAENNTNITVSHIPLYI
jgi:hypothetical protein